jgi:hypothetical protein
VNYPNRILSKALACWSPAAEVAVSLAAMESHIPFQDLRADKLESNSREPVLFGLTIC